MTLEMENKQSLDRWLDVEVVRVDPLEYSGGEWAVGKSLVIIAIKVVDSRLIESTAVYIGMRVMPRPWRELNINS